MKSPASHHTWLRTEHEMRITVILGVVAALVGVAHQAILASDLTTDSGHWNIRVVPSREAAYSGQARELFNQHCAKCHSKDGRAQTPIARQRRVQDLSESRLTDDIIIEQIVEGTHNKAKTFSMPPFKNTLSRAQVESLVPLVKAFRPVSPEQAGRTAARPRLVGMITLPHRNYAVLERVPFSGRYFILAERERHDGVGLARITPRNGSVRLNVDGAPPTTLKLDGVDGQPKGAARSFLRSCFDCVTDNNATHSITLEKASTELVLFLYGQFTGRTVLCLPTLPPTSFNLSATATSPALLAISLQQALAEKGIAIIPDRGTLMLVGPSPGVENGLPFSPEFKMPMQPTGQAKLFPGGAFINLPNTEVSQVARLYATLTGRQLDRTQDLSQFSGTVTFTTHTALTSEECVYAIETLLRWQGLKVVPTGIDAFRIARLANAEE